MFHILRKKKEIVVESPNKGKVCSLSESEDETFRSGVLGKGCFIQPRCNEIFAPMDGVITSVFPTLHAFGMKGNNGLEIMIHIGIDTVYLKGECFESFLHVNQKVIRGDLLMNVNFKKINEHGYCSDVYVFVTNADEYEIELYNLDHIVSAGDKLMLCRRKENE